MKQSIRSKHSFFESMKQAKEEFKALTEIHPELAELSPREIEVLTSSCRIRHWQKSRRKWSSLTPLSISTAKTSTAS